MRPYLHSRQQTKVAMTLAAMLISGFTPVISEPTHPAWWDDPARGVKNANPIQNKGVANIGQLKNMATQARAELESLLPGGAGYVLPFDPPPVPADAAWYQNQKKALNLGQLKAVAKPLYERLNTIAPNWVLAQLQTNGLSILDTDYFQQAGFYYPWNPSTPVAENYKPANVGQLKLVFAFKLREDSDTDGLPDIFEYELISLDTSGNLHTLADVLPGDDFDNDGLTNLEEFQLQSNAAEANFSEAIGAEQYIYDDLGRLKNVTGSQSRTYQYDPSGNIETAN